MIELGGWLVHVRLGELRLLLVLYGNNSCTMELFLRVDRQPNCGLLALGSIEAE